MLSGTPTTAGTYTFTVTSNSSQGTRAQVFTLNVKAPLDGLQPSQRAGSVQNLGGTFQNENAFAALKADGSISVWGQSDSGGSGAPTGTTGTGFTQIFSSVAAFAALKPDGSISAWGHAAFGGSGAPTGTGFTQVFSSSRSFAALKTDGSISAWGDSSATAGAPTGTGFTRLLGNDGAYTALKADGSLTSWGDPSKGATGAPTGTGFTRVYTNTGAFAALKADGSISTWGDQNYGATGAPTGTGFTQVFASDRAFAALKTDGSISAWGDTAAIAGAPASSGYTQVFATSRAFAALKISGSNTNGSISAWGDAASGGSGAPSPAFSTYTQLSASRSAFAALKKDGSITAWGSSTAGGSGAPTSTGFTQVVSTSGAFAALKADGSIIAWGDPSNGGTGAPVGLGFTQLFGNARAFTALKADGSITSWGDAAYGGSGAPVGSGYLTVQSSQAINPVFASFPANPSLSASIGQSLVLNLGAQAVGARYAVIAGALPAGLTLDAATGVLSGIPTMLGSTFFTLAASNPEGVDSQTFNVVVGAATANAPTFVSPSGTTATVGSPASFAFSTEGSTTNLAYAITKGTLPLGLTLNASTGVISGTPAATSNGAASGGTYTLEITATNNVGPSSQQFTLTLNQAPEITSAATFNGTPGAPLDFKFAATGFPAPTFTVVSGVLPTGLELSSSGVLKGIADAASLGSRTIIVQATNGIGEVATKTITLNLAAMAATALKITAPTGVVSGKANTIEVQAVDAYGNVDRTASGTVTLTASGAGNLEQAGSSGALTASLSNGVATFTGIAYQATADGESFTLGATASSLTSATSPAISADVVATQFQIVGTPTPSTLQSGVANSLSGLRLVAVDAAGRIDRSWLASGQSVQLSLTGTGGASLPPNGAVNGLSLASGSVLSDTDTSATTITLNSSAIGSDGSIDLGALQLDYTNPSGSNTVNLALKAERLGGSGPAITGSMLSSFTSVSAPAGNSAPQLNLDLTNAPTAFSENGSPMAIVGPGASVSDADNSLQSLQVSISNLQVGDLLALASTPSGLTATFDASTGSLLIKAAANATPSLADFQSALRAVRYSNSSDNPDTTPRQIKVTANDGSGLATATATASLTVAVTATDDPTTLTNLPGSIAATEDTTAPLNLGALVLSDPDSGDALQTLTLSVRQGSTLSGSLSASNRPGVTVSGSNSPQLTLEGSIAALNSYLQTAGVLNFTPASTTHGAYALSVDLGTGNTLQSLGSTTINVAAVNDAAVFSGVPTAAAPARLRHGVATSLQRLIGNTPISLADSDLADYSATTQVTLSVSNASLGGLSAGAHSGGATLTTSSASTWQVAGTLAQVNALLADSAITLQSAAAGTVSLSLTANDGSSVAGATTTSTVQFPAVSDPLINNSYSSNASPRTISTGFEESLSFLTITDPDAGTNPQTFTLTLTDPGNSGVLYGLTDASSSSGIQLTGTRDQINLQLSNGRFKAAADGLTSLQLSLSNGLGPAVTSTVNLSAVNTLPTLSTVSTLAGGQEDSLLAISFADLAAAANDADMGGSVEGFVVKALSSGTLLIGTTASTAAAWAAGTNDRINTNRSAYWMPAANANGTGNSALTAFTVVALDNSGGESSTPVAVKVDVAAVNDAPSISGIPSSAGSVTTGQNSPLADVTVADSDSSTLTLTLEAINGTIGNLTDADSNRSGIQLTGTASSINTAVANATFNATTSGAASINLRLEDGGTEAATATYLLTASASNSAPSLTTLNTTRAITTGLADALSYFSVSDSDAGQSLTLTLNPSGGSFRNLADVDPNTSGTQLSGTASAINQALAAGSFVASADGAASITVSASDGIASPVSTTYNLTASNALPTLTQVNALGGAKEDLDYTITFAALLAASNAADAGGSITGFVVTAVDGSKGTLSIGGNPWSSGSNDSIDLSHAAIWRPAANLYGTGTDAISAFTVKALDDLGGLSTTGCAVRINLDPVNDAPTLSGVPTGTTAINTGISTSTGAGLADFTVADLDDTSLAVTLLASNGIITGLTDVDTVTDGIQLIGSASAINAALAGANFTASTDGDASIAISLSDGSSLLAKGTYRFAATTVNSAPSVSTQASPRLSYSGLADSIGYITVGDPDVGQTLSVTLNVSGGSFRNLADADPNSSGIQLRGDASAINNALNLGSFVPSTVGNASITLTVSDGIANSVSSVFNITASNPAPTLYGAISLSGVTEDLASNITYQDLLAASNAADSNGSVTGFKVTAVNSTMGSLKIGGTNWVVGSNDTIDPNHSATWTPYANRNGSLTAALTIKAIDDLGDLSTASSVNITVAAVNDAPSLIAGSYSFTGVSEDSTTAGVAISTLLASRGSDAESATLGVAIKQTSGLGAWEFTTNGTSWTPIGTVSTTSALLLGATSQVRYVPDGINGETGGSAPTLTFHAWDGTDGSTAGTKLDVSNTGGASAFSSATNTASVSVSVVDDPLTLTLSGPAAVTYLENDQYLLDAAFTLEDPDSNTSVTGATIEISAATYRSGEDYLEVTASNRYSGSDTNGTMRINGSTISYSFSGGLMSLTGTASQAIYQEALRRVSYRNDSDNPNTSAREITVTAGSMLVKYLTDSDNVVRPHFYEYVQVGGSGISWTSARDAAAARTYAGMQGYLATITSSTESNYIRTRLGGSGAWIGASDASTEGTWKWVTGPEAGTTFWKGNWSSSWGLFSGTTWSLSGSGAVGGAFNSWATHEPNNAGGEDYAQILADGSGDWNDIANTDNRSAYLVEYSSPSVTSISFSKSITLTPARQNDAPELGLSGNYGLLGPYPFSPSLTAVNEDATTGANTGNLVSSFIKVDANNNTTFTDNGSLTDANGLNTITDADTGALRGGIAITALNSGNGTWQFRLDNIGDWQSMGAISNANALLLRPTDAVRFVPDGENATNATFTYRAWDRSSGTAGTRANTTSNGGTTAFSTATNDVSIAVTAVNDAPTWGDTNTIQLPSAVRSEASDVFNVAKLLAGSVVDVDRNASAGIAITGISKTNSSNAVVSDNGRWQYRTSANGIWNDLTAASDSAARLLDAGSDLRYVPDSATVGTVIAGLSFRAWDTTSGTNGNPANTTGSGGTMAFSSSTRNLNLQVNGVTLQGNLNGVSATEGTDQSIGSGLSLSGTGTLSFARVQIAKGYSSGDQLVLPANSTGISGQWDSALATLTLSGSASVADYQSALQSVQYRSGDDPTAVTATRTIGWFLEADSTSANYNTSAAFRTLTISAAADAPVISTGSLASFTESGTAVAIAPNFSLSDVDDIEIVSASVTIGAANLRPGDTLSLDAAVANDLGITVSYNASTGVLSLSGTRKKENYEQALREVRFSSTNAELTHNGAAPNRTLTWSVLDANSDGVGAATGTASGTLEIQAINSAPVIALGSGTNNVAYSEGGAAVVLNAAISLSDADDTELTQASVQISNVMAGDVLALGSGAPSSITAQYISNQGGLLLTPASPNTRASLADFQAALRTVTFSSSSDDPTAQASTRTISWSIRDANSDGAAGGMVGYALPSATTVTITPVADAPLLTGSNASSPSFTEGGSAVAIAPSLSLSDGDDTQFTKAVVSISSGFSNGDLLAYTSVPGITGSYDKATGLLTFTGSASLADYQTLLRSITYSNNSAALASGTRTISWKVLDANSDGLTPQWSTDVTSTVTVTGINQAPTLAVVSLRGSYVENDSATVVQEGITLGDLDSSQLSGATVSITSGFTAGDTLALGSSVTGITAAYNSTTGVLSLTGAASMGDYQTALGAITYSSTSNDPTVGNTVLTRTLTWQVTDQDNTPANQRTSAAVTSTIQLVGVNDNPTLSAFTPVSPSAPAMASGVEDQAITITYADLIGTGSPRAQVADVDGTVTSLRVFQLLSGSLRLGSSSATATAYAAGMNDTIHATNNAYWTPASNVNGSGASALGAFSVVALDDVGAVSIAPRTVWVDVTPDHADAAQITGVNLPANATYTTGQTLDFSLVFDRAVTVATSGGTPMLPFTLDAGTGASAAYLSGSGTSTLLFRYTVGSGDHDTNGLAVGSAISLNGGAITSLDDGQPVAINLTLPGVSSTAGLLVDGINDAPVLATNLTGINYQEGDPAIALNPALALSDSDSSQISAASVSITAGFTAGDTLSLPISVAGITVSGYNASTGVLSLSGDAALADYQRALRAVTYSSSSSNPTGGGSASRTVSWQVTDRDNSSPATSAVVTSSVTLTAVNNNPTLSTFSAPLINGAEDTTITIRYSDLIGSVSGQAQVADVDGTVTSLEVTELLSGTLKIGTSLGTATPFVAGSNALISANTNPTTNAYWTPAPNANGTGINALSAFTVVARDDGGALSLQPRTVLVNVTADQADGAQISKLILPANGIYNTGQNLDFSVVFDRVVTVTTSGGTPKLPITLNTGSGAAAEYRSGSGSNTLVFRYTVSPGDNDANGLDVGSAINLNGGAITSLDDGQPVAVNLTLPGVSPTAGLLVDGINDAPELSSPSTLSVRYTEGDSAVTLNPDLALSDSDSTGFSVATVRISAGFTAGDVLALSSSVSTSTGVVSSWNANTATLTLTPAQNATPSLLDLQRALQAVTYASSSENPTLTSNSRTITWQLSDNNPSNAGGPALSNQVSGSFTVTAVNDAPSLSTISQGVVSTVEDTDAEISFETLVGLSDAADVDDQVTAFVVKAVTSGTLRLGSSALSATAWSAGGNAVINSATRAYWTPPADANGNALSAFTVVARDNGGQESTTTPLVVSVDVTPVADSAQITSFQLPANGTYGPGDTLKFAISLDRAVSLDSSGGVPGLSLQLGGGRTVQADLLSPQTSYGAGTQLVFGYTVLDGDESRSTGLGLPTSLTLPSGSTLTNLDDGQSVDVTLTLPSATGGGVLVDGVLPQLANIKANSNSRSNRATQTFRISFSEAVRHVDPSDFRLSGTGSATGVVGAIQAVSPVNGVATDYDLTVTEISGLGRLILQPISADTGIRDAVGNPIALDSSRAGSIEVDRVGAISTVALDDRLSLVEITNSQGLEVQGTVSLALAGQQLDLSAAPVGNANAVTALVSTTALSDGSWNAVVPLSVLNQLTTTGDYTLTLKQAASTLGTRAFAIDRIAPSLPNPTNDPANNPALVDLLLNRAETSNGLTIKGSSDAENGQTVAVRFGQLRSEATVVNGSWEAQFSRTELGALNEGSVNLGFEVSDLAGNRTKFDTSLTLDTTAGLYLAPLAADGWMNGAERSQPLTINGLVNGIENGRTLTVTVKDANNQPVAANAAVTISNGAFSYQVAANTFTTDNATYTVEVSGTDAAGNPAVATGTFTTDYTAPTVDLKLGIGSQTPVDLSGYSGAVNAANLGAGLRISSAAAPDAVNTVVTVGSNAPTLVTPLNGSWGLNLDPNLFSLPVESAVTITATVTDRAGNTAVETSTLNIDRVAGISFGAAIDGNNNQINATEALSLTIAGTTSSVQNGANVSVQLWQGGSQVGNAYTATVSNGAWSISNVNGSSWPEGSLELRATVTDSAGNVANATQAVRVNRTAPGLTATEVSGDNRINSAEVTGTTPPAFSGVVVNAEDGQQVSVTLPGAGNVAGRTLTAPVASGVWSLPIPADLLAAYGADNGTYTATVALANQAGNSASTTVAFAVDTAAPQLTLNAVSDAQWGASALDPTANPLVLSGTVQGLENGQSVSVVINGTELQASRGSGNTWSLSVGRQVLQSLRAAGNQLLLKARDLAGNLSSLSQSFNANAVDTTPPVITGLPSSRTISVDEGALLIAQFKANTNVTWSLEGVNADQLQINASTGSFSFVKEIDLADTDANNNALGDSTFSFTLVATDGRGNQRREPLTLQVRNLPEPTPDLLDQDGIAASVEDGATNGRSTTPGDLNNDGIPDRLQPNVAGVPWITQANFQAGISNPNQAAPDSFATLQSSPEVRIVGVNVVKPEDLAVEGNGSSVLPALIQSGGTSKSFTAPYDPLVFRLQSYDPTTEQALTCFVDLAPALSDGSDPYPGYQVRQLIDLPGNGLAINTYLKWNPSANNGAGAWFEFLADGDPNTYDNGAELFDNNGDGLVDQIQLTYTDGAPAGGDIDGLVNGIIDDPGMPGLVQAAPSALPFFYGADLVTGQNITRPTVSVVTSAASQLALANASVTSNATGVAAQVQLQYGDGQASFNSAFDLVGSGLAITDSQGRRLANRRLAYYTVGASADLVPLSYDPRQRAGARFYDRDGDHVADFLSLSLVDGRYGDLDTAAETITNTSFAATVDLNPVLARANANTLTVSDPTNTEAAANLVLRASLSGRASSANQIGYVVLDPVELATADTLLADITTLRNRAQTLYSTLESSDVTLPDGSTFERDLVLTNGKSVRFFEVDDATLDDLTSLADSRFRYLSLGDVFHGAQVSVSSVSGVSFMLSLVNEDQGLGALIGQAQGLALVLDFSSFTISDVVRGTVVISREARYDSVTGFYRTLNAQGLVRAADGQLLNPEDVGYAAAALRADNLVGALAGFRVGDNQISSRSFELTETNFLAPYVQVNGDAYFAYAPASSDGCSHFRLLGTNMFGMEDLRGLGDRDYDDQVLGFTFKPLN